MSLTKATATYQLWYQITVQSCFVTRLKITPVSTLEEDRTCSIPSNRRFWRFTLSAFKNIRGPAANGINEYYGHHRFAK